MQISELTLFFGYMSLINITILLFSALFVTIGRNFTINLHSKLFKINRASLPAFYFQYLGFYKIAIILLNIAPFLALKIIT